jgi:hypothetical protein
MACKARVFLRSRARESSRPPHRLRARWAHTCLFCADPPAFMLARSPPGDAGRAPAKAGCVGDPGDMVHIWQGKQVALSASGVKKLSKGTSKRRRQKAFPLNFGVSPSLTALTFFSSPPGFFCLKCAGHAPFSPRHHETLPCTCMTRVVSSAALGSRPRPDEKTRRLKANVEKKLAADGAASSNSSALKVMNPLLQKCAHNSHFFLCTPSE